MEENREKRLLKENDKLTLIVASLLTVVLIILYFVLNSAAWIPPTARGFISGLILNLIPVLLIFMASYFVFRRIQKIKSEHETESLVEEITSRVGIALEGELQNFTSRTVNTEKREVLVRDSETKTIHLVDRFGSSHPVTDENTAFYLAEILEYQVSELAEVSSDELRPVGAEVEAIYRWRPPRSQEDELASKMTHIAETSLKLLKREIGAEGGAQVLSIYLRNDNEDSIQIDLAELVFEDDAPMSSADISPKNGPLTLGLLTCTLLFEGANKSKRLSSQEESRLDLFLQRQFSERDSPTITSLRLGYINIKGSFRDTPVHFHKDV